MRGVKLLRMAAQRPLLDGVFAINKPLGMSSAQVIRDCQYHFNPSNFFKPMIEHEKEIRSHESNSRRKKRGFGKNDVRVKMGHGGTLDPLATGVLILGVGKGTKSLQSFLDCTKTYETIVLFGASTDTYDRVGKVLKKTAYDHITRPMVEEALKTFRGKQEQMPPLYSALKMEGKPLYEYAREGKQIPREIATREVTVTELELLEWYEPGTHNHRWPAEDATAFERNFAEEVWKIEKNQVANGKRTPEEEEEESKAREAHENFKRKADARVDELVYDKFNKRRRHNGPDPMMSGALGDTPPPKGKGSNLVPAPPDPDTPPPWDDKGPPAARIRMTVTSGFYVRSFCHDLGVKVGSAAMMAELCRSRQGDFKLGGPNCLEYTDLAKGEDVWAPQVERMLGLWKQKHHSAAPSSPTRARHNSSPSRDTFDKKRKATNEHGEDSSPKRNRPHAPSINGKAASPLAESKADGKAEDAVEELIVNGATAAAMESQETSVAKQAPKSSQAESEEEWNGFSDTPKSTR